VVAHHKGTGPKAGKGVRPIVIVAHYDTQHLDFMAEGGMAPYAKLVYSYAPLCLAVAALMEIIQLFVVLPGVVLTVAWVLGMLATLPALVWGIAKIYHAVAPLNESANDNKAGVAALLDVMDAVAAREGHVPAPAAEPVDLEEAWNEFIEAADGIEAATAEKDLEGDAAAAAAAAAAGVDAALVAAAEGATEGELEGFDYAPERGAALAGDVDADATATLAHVHADGTVEHSGVWHGEAYLRAMGIVPDTCVITYVEPQPVAPAEDTLAGAGEEAGAGSAEVTGKLGRLALKIPGVAAAAGAATGGAIAGGVRTSKATVDADMFDEEGGAPAPVAMGKQALGSLRTMFGAAKDRARGLAARSRGEADVAPIPHAGGEGVHGAGVAATGVIEDVAVAEALEAATEASQIAEAPVAAFDEELAEGVEVEVPVAPVAAAPEVVQFSAGEAEELTFDGAAFEAVRHPSHHEEFDGGATELFEVVPEAPAEPAASVDITAFAQTMHATEVPAVEDAPSVDGDFAQEDDVQSTQEMQVERRVVTLPQIEEAWGVDVRRATLFDLPDPSENLVDPLAPAGEVANAHETFENLGGRSSIEIQELVDEAPADNVVPFEPLSRGAQAPLPARKGKGKKNAHKRGDKNGWKGGAALNEELRGSNFDLNTHVNDDEELFENEEEFPNAELLAHDIWFVAVGASSMRNAGAKNFIERHRKDLRGALVFNLCGVGAGDLAVLTSEGTYEPRRVDRRILRTLTHVAKQAHVELANVARPWMDSDAVPFMRAAIRAATITGLGEGDLTAYSCTKEDVAANVSPKQVSRVAQLVTQAIRES
jgi:hypothetical protein